MKTKKSVMQKIRGAVAGGLVGLMGLTSGCQTPLNSTRIERALTSEATIADGVMGGRPYKDGDVLYVRMQDAGNVLKEQYGLDIENRAYPALYQGNLVQIKYTDPKTNQTVVDSQTIAADCTIDTLDFGSFNACVSRSSLDDAITKEANSNGVASVSVTQVAFPMAEGSDQFMGKAFYLGEKDHELVSGVAYLPQKAHRVLLDSGVGHDAKYVEVVMNVGNGQRVVAIADAVACQTGKVTMTLGHDDTVIMVGRGLNSSWTDMRENLQEVGGIFNDFTGASDAIQAAHKSLDTGFRRNYLERNNLPNESCLDKAAKNLGKVKEVTGGFVGLKGDIKTLTTPAATEAK